MGILRRAIFEVAITDPEGCRFVRINQTTSNQTNLGLVCSNVMSFGNTLSGVNILHCFIIVGLEGKQLFMTNTARFADDIRLR